MPEDVKRRRPTRFSHAVKLIHLSFVLAMSALNMSARIPRLFRTYQAPKYRSPNCTIWEAVRATSAVPTFFPRIVIDGEPYVDGGMGCNNPVQQVLQEAELLFPDRHVACVISIGTGQAHTIGIQNQAVNSRWSMLSERSPPIAKRVHKSPHDVLNVPQESIFASTSSKGCRKLD